MMNHEALYPLAYAKEKSILFVGDLHIDVAVSSRSDNYLSTCMQKLRFVLNYAEESKLAVVFLGDIFSRQLHHKKTVAWYVFTLLVSLFKDYTVPMYSIVGNHDIVMEDLDSITKTPLGTLFALGFITPLGRLYLPTSKVVVMGTHYTDNIVNYDTATLWYEENLSKETSKEVSKEEVDYKISVAHMFFEDAARNKGLFLSFGNVQNLGYDAIVLGHDHTPQGKVMVATPQGYTSIIRPGALLRNSSHESNLNRDVFVSHFDGDSKEFTPVVVPSSPSLKVFKSASMLKQKPTSIVDLKESLSSLLSSFKGQNKTILDFLPEDTPKAVKERIISYL